MHTQLPKINFLFHIFCFRLKKTILTKYAILYNKWIIDDRVKYL